MSFDESFRQCLSFHLLPGNVHAAERSLGSIHALSRSVFAIRTRSKGFLPSMTSLFCELALLDMATHLHPTLGQIYLSSTKCCGTSISLLDIAALLVIASNGGDNDHQGDETASTSTAPLMGSIATIVQRRSKGSLKLLELLFQLLVRQGRVGESHSALGDELLPDIPVKILNAMANLCVCLISQPLQHDVHGSTIDAELHRRGIECAMQRCIPLVLHRVQHQSHSILPTLIDHSMRHSSEQASSTTANVVCAVVRSCRVSAIAHTLRSYLSRWSSFDSHAYCTMMRVCANASHANDDVHPMVLTHVEELWERHQHRTCPSDDARCIRYSLLASCELLSAWRHRCGDGDPLIHQAKPLFHRIARALRTILSIDHSTTTSTRDAPGNPQASYILEPTEWMCEHIPQDQTLHLLSSILGAIEKCTAINGMRKDISTLVREVVIPFCERNGALKRLKVKGGHAEHDGDGVDDDGVIYALNGIWQRIPSKSAPQSSFELKSHHVIALIGLIVRSEFFSTYHDGDDTNTQTSDIADGIQRVLHRFRLDLSNAPWVAQALKETSLCSIGPSPFSLDHIVMLSPPTSDGASPPAYGASQDVEFAMGNMPMHDCTVYLKSVAVICNGIVQSCQSLFHTECNGCHDDDTDVRCAFNDDAKHVSLIDLWSVLGIALTNHFEICSHSCDMMESLIPSPSSSSLAMHGGDGNSIPLVDRVVHILTHRPTLWPWVISHLEGMMMNSLALLSDSFGVFTAGGTREWSSSDALESEPLLHVFYWISSIARLACTSPKGLSHGETVRAMCTLHKSLCRCVSELRSISSSMNAHHHGGGGGGIDTLSSHQKEISRRMLHCLGVSIPTTWSDGHEPEWSLLVAECLTSVWEVTLDTAGYCCGYISSHAATLWKDDVLGHGDDLSMMDETHALRASTLNAPHALIALEMGLVLSHNHTSACMLAHALERFVRHTHTDASRLCVLLCVLITQIFPSYHAMSAFNRRMFSKTVRSSNAKDSMIWNAPKISIPTQFLARLSRAEWRCGSDSAMKAIDEAMEHLQSPTMSNRAGSIMLMILKHYHASKREEGEDVHDVHEDVHEDGTSIIDSSSNISKTSMTTNNKSITHETGRIAIQWSLSTLLRCLHDPLSGSTSIDYPYFSIPMASFSSSNDSSDGVTLCLDFFLMVLLEAIEQQFSRLTTAKEPIDTDHPILSSLSRRTFRVYFEEMIAALRIFPREAQSALDKSVFLSSFDGMHRTRLFSSIVSHRCWLFSRAIAMVCSDVRTSVAMDEETYAIEDGVDVDGDDEERVLRGKTIRLVLRRGYAFAKDVKKMMKCLMDVGSFLVIPKLVDEDEMDDDTIDESNDDDDDDDQKSMRRGLLSSIQWFVIAWTELIDIMWAIVSHGRRVSKKRRRTTGEEMLSVEWKRKIPQMQKHAQQLSQVVSQCIVYGGNTMNEFEKDAYDLFESFCGTTGVMLSCFDKYVQRVRKQIKEMSSHALSNDVGEPSAFMRHLACWPGQEKPFDVPIVPMHVKKRTFGGGGPTMAFPEDDGFRMVYRKDGM